MAIQNFEETNGIVSGRHPNTSGIPGTGWGEIAQQNIYVEKENGSIALDVVLNALVDEQKYIIYGGMIDYVAEIIANGETHPNLIADSEFIHRLPYTALPVTIVDDGDTGRKKLTGNVFGICHIRFRDQNNYKKFAEIIVEPRVRDSLGNEITSTIQLLEGNSIDLTFYAGWEGAQVTWVNPDKTKIGFSPGFKNSNGNGIGPTVRVIGIAAGGPFVVTVNGRQGTTAQFNIEVIAAP